MNKLKIIKKFKAYAIKFKIHKLLGRFADLFIYAGYLLKLSKWVDNNKKALLYNDFYNSKVVHSDRIELYKFLLENDNLANENINYIEFGVGRGNSMRWWTENNINKDSTFYGFDTFEGLPEKYGTYEKGVFSLGGNFPDIKDKRIKFIKGLFQNTLKFELPNIDFSKKNIIHLDADLYTSTLYALTVIYYSLKKDDIIIFDEFCVPFHEFKAFDDFSKAYSIKLIPIGAINNYLQMVFKVE
ncbi:TylF/MycF/NovP-related O-methyltransferase [Bacteroidota bacterium]